MNILYVGNHLSKAKTGADQVNMRNQTVLEKLGKVTYIHLSHNILSRINFSVSNSVLKRIYQELSISEYNYIFIQQSLLGRVCSSIKRKYPTIPIILFFHNIERKYAREYLKIAGIKAFPFYWFVRYWEKKAIKNSDIYITLNKRDSELLYDYYKVRSNLILPTSFRDVYCSHLLPAKECVEIIDYLFVGVAFFANIEGIQWFITHVFPYVKGNLYIIGNNMDKIKFSGVNDRIHVLGFVDNLTSFYERARFIVLPIFSGAGMKTKTAEALMYGKNIIGTKEAFEGYEIDERCMIECNNAQEFISAINDHSNLPLYNLNSRELFLKNYTYESSLQQLKTIIK